MLIERLRTSVSHALSQVVKPDLNETKIESRSQVAVLDFFSAVGFSNPTAIIKKKPTGFIQSGFFDVDLF